MDECLTGFVARISRRRNAGNCGAYGFLGTDLQNSLFMNTNLKHADFTNAVNYTIDIHANKLTQAKFSFPDVVVLLSSLDIKIDGWPNDDEY